MRLKKHLFRITGRWLIGLWLFCNAVSLAEAKPSLVDAQLGLTSGLTRVVLTFSQKVEYRIFALADPYRIVIDTDEVVSQLPKGEKLLGQGHVTAMRYGLFKAGTSRIVLDLNEPIKIQQALFLPGNTPDTVRLLVDLASDNEANFRNFVKATNKLQPITETAKSPPPSPEALSPAKNKRSKFIVVIDSGHGGVDPGTAAPTGKIFEKDVTLAVARRLAQELSNSGRYEVKLTRSNDVFIPLRERFKIAREVDADIFISLHADSHPNPTTRGASVYTLSDKASDAEADALASKENKSDVIAGLDLSHESPIVTDILIDLSQRETNNRSVKVAQNIVSHLSRSIRMLKKPQRSAGFAVLKAPDIPSILIEMGYLSNKEDAALLNNKAHQIKIAKALKQAIDAYFTWQKGLKPT